MKRGSHLDVLLALLGTRTEGAIDGATVSKRLEQAGHTPKASALLAQLLAFENSGLVEVDRTAGYRFALTDRGESMAYDLGPGEPIEVVLVMVDLVGFVAFTAAHGDGAAHEIARRLQDVGEVELARAKGRLVKPLGDGFLGTVGTYSDARDVVRTVADRCIRPDGEQWRLRAAAHRGRPIAFRGDLFGADVNLASRLCESAQPGELVMSAAPDDRNAEQIAVRGLDTTIAVNRVALT